MTEQPKTEAPESLEQELARIEWECASRGPAEAVRYALGALRTALEKRNEAQEGAESWKRSARDYERRAERAELERDRLREALRRHLAHEPGCAGLAPVTTEDWVPMPERCDCSWNEDRRLLSGGTDDR